jgi:RimJ/RimL family protein N-acetyltransferase
MSGLARIEGPNLVLRLIRPDDADYLYGLRTDPAYNRHLSPVRGTAEDQRRWIEAYKEREAKGREFYYMIERRDGVRCGVVRLYDIEADQFTWGSWVLDHNKPPKAALESAVLSFGVGFEHLEKLHALVDVRVQNARAIAFYNRFGMGKIRDDELNVYFIYPRETFLADRHEHLAVIAAENGQ